MTRSDADSDSDSAPKVWAAGSNNVCLLCHKTFTTPRGARHHKMIHTGECPYQCTYPGCARYFNQVSNMRRHRATHDKGEGTSSVAAAPSRRGRSPATPSGDEIDEDHVSKPAPSRLATSPTGPFPFHLFPPIPALLPPTYPRIARAPAAG
ncbi:ADL040Wp [Mycena kentingensis (nom. inval.)]|nr:ADL040Wp [Mycena kentingensis (nom. inval.)]